jgi:hypothetical protein
MKNVILTKDHTHAGVELQPGAKLTVCDQDASFMVAARVARVVEAEKITQISIEGDTK